MWTLKHVFNLSIETVVFLDKLKIAVVSPVYKARHGSDLSNYRSIFVISCFSEILERIMYNRLFSYVSQEKIFKVIRFSIWSFNRACDSPISKPNLRILLK